MTVRTVPTVTNANSMDKKLKNRIVLIFLSLIMVLTMMPSASFAAGEDITDGNGQAAGAEAVEETEDAEDAEVISEDEFEILEDDAVTNDPIQVTDAADGEDIRAKVPFSIPRVIVRVSGGKKEIDRMNSDEEHNERCTGTIDIEVPEGFRYADTKAGVTLASMKGLSLEYIRGRGNTTWSNDGKRPYKIKLNKKAALLGMEKNKSWALIANAFDPSLSRNRITYWLGRELGVEFTPEASPVDVFVGSDDDGDGDGKADGYEYYGSYLLTNIPKNSISIDQPSKDVRDGVELTGGYLLSMMQDSESPDTFVTRKRESLQNIDPSYDTEDGGFDNDTQKEYIRSYLQEAEDALFEGETADKSEPSGYRKLDYRDYFDMDAAAKYWLFQEFTANGDAYRTGSTYFFKTRDDEDGKIHWGPLWDFDFAWDYITTDDQDWFNTDMGWMTAMMYDRSEGGLYDLVIKKWPEMREKLLYIADDEGLLEQYYEEMNVSQKADYEQNYKEGALDNPAEDYGKAVDTLRQWIIDRVGWMDEHLGELDHFSHRITLMDDSDDEHPQMFYTIDSHSPSFNEDTPEKKGKVFLGWYIEDENDPDYGQSIFDVSGVDRDIVATARYISEEDATKATDIFFARDVFAVSLNDKYFDIPYTLIPEDVQDKRIKWKSSDTSIAEIDLVNGSNIVNLISPGTVKITATLSNGKTKSFKLIINKDKVYPTGFELTHDTIYMKPGDIRHLGCRIIPEGAEADTFYMNEDDEIAFTDQNGVITAWKPGRTRISVSASAGTDDGKNIEFIKYCDVIVSADEGNLTTETRTTGVEGTAFNIAEVAAALLTEEDKADLFGGADIRVWLEMNALEEGRVPAEDKKPLLGFMDKYELIAGRYIDISLFKKIGENDAEAVHNTKVPLKFSIEIPEELKLKNADAEGRGINEEGKSAERTFYLIRVHDGIADCVAKGTGDTLECSSMLFSTYMLAYRDDTEEEDTVPVADDIADDADPTDEGSGSSSTKAVRTGDTSFLLLWVAVLVLALLLGGIMLAIYRKNLDKSDKNDRE